VVLLPEQPSPVVTRELLYTAVTRARSTVCLHGTREALRDAIERRIQRSSGLRDLLWQGA
jgi:exodeoxyribonuclease V alpha subunit